VGADPLSVGHEQLEHLEYGGGRSPVPAADGDPRTHQLPPAAQRHEAGGVLDDQVPRDLAEAGAPGHAAADLDRQAADRASVEALEQAGQHEIPVLDVADLVVTTASSSRSSSRSSRPRDTQTWALRLVRPKVKAFGEASSTSPRVTSGMPACRQRAATIPPGGSPVA